MYEYVTIAPTSQMSGFVFLVLCLLGIIASVLCLSAIYNIVTGFLEDAINDAVLTIIFGLVFSCLFIFEKNFRDPLPDFTQVTATRIGSGDFGREETSGKYPTTLAGYLAYRINDGSNMTYFVRVYNGTVIADEILLFKVAKK